MADRDCGYDAAGNAKTYTTIAAAVAAAANGDNIRLYYSNATKRRVWNEVMAAATLVVGIEGMLSHRQVTMVTGYLDFHNMSGDLSGQATQVTIQNLSAVCSPNKSFIRYSDTSGTGGGVRVTNCFTTGGSHTIYFAAAAANVCQVDNCCVVNASGWSIRATIACKIYNNTVIGSIALGIHCNNQASTVTNNVCAWNESADFSNMTNATVTYCASSDATADDVGGAGNIINQTQDDFDFYLDNAPAGGSIYPLDYRVIMTSTLYHAGTPVTGITTDCDGNDRDESAPSIGWHEGTAKAYPSPYDVPYWPGGDSAIAEAS